MSRFCSACWILLNIVALMEEGRTKRTFSARVEVAFKDVYRLVLFPGDRGPFFRGYP